MRAVNTEGKERAEEQARIAKELGLALPTPFFALGTELIDSGKDRAQQLRKDFDQLPTVINACETGAAHVENERRRDIVCTIGDLYMSPDGKIHRRSRPNGGIKLSERALVQLVSRCGAVKGDYLIQIPPDRRAKEVNHWIAGVDKPDKEMMVRVWRPVGHDEHSCYAIMSNKHYTDYNAGMIFKDLARAFNVPDLKDARADLRYHGESGSMRITAHTDAGRDLTVGEVFQAGVEIRWGDDGSAGLNGLAFALRALCINLTFAGSKAKVFSLRHTGDVEALRAEVRKALAKARKAIEPWLTLWGERSKVRIDVPQAIDALTLLNMVKEREATETKGRAALANALIRVPGESPVYTAEQIHKAWHKEPNETITGLANAMTRAAHESPWKGATAGEVLQDQAVALMEMSPERLIATIAEETRYPSLASIVRETKNPTIDLNEIARNSRGN